MLTIMPPHEFLDPEVRITRCRKVVRTRTETLAAQHHMIDAGYWGAGIPRIDIEIISFSSV